MSSHLISTLFLVDLLSFDTNFVFYNLVLEAAFSKLLVKVSHIWSQLTHIIITFNLSIDMW